MKFKFLVLLLLFVLKSFVIALINMVCELKITAGSTKNCAKVPWWSDISLNSYWPKTQKQGYAAYEIHSRIQFSFSLALKKLCSFSSFGRSHLLMFMQCCFQYHYSKLILPCRNVGYCNNSLFLTFLIF